MSDEVTRIADDVYMSFGSSGIKRSEESRQKDFHNKWRRAALSVCWDCGFMASCNKQCKKVQDFLRDIEREDLIFGNARKEKEK